MPDIFDEIAPDNASGGDIFDEIAPDAPTQATESTPPGISKPQSVWNSLVRGVKTAQAIPDTLLAAGTSDLGKPTIKQSRRAYVEAMSDPAYQEGLMRAGDDRVKLNRVESLRGPAGKLDIAMSPARAIQTETARDLATAQAEIQAIPRSAAQQRLGAAATSSEKWAAWRKDPIELTAGIVAESLPASITGGIVGTFLGGPGVGTAMGAGGSSGLMTFAGEFLGGAQAQGVDITNPQALEAFLNDKRMFDAAFNTAITKAAIVGGVDAGTAGIAGRWIEPALKLGLKQRVIASAKELALQAGGGAGGEALGQVAAGQQLDPFDIAMEAMAEVATAPTEAVGNILSKKKGEPLPDMRSANAHPMRGIENDFNNRAVKPDIFDEVAAETIPQSQSPLSPDVPETTGSTEQQTPGAVSATSPASGASPNGSQPTADSRQRIRQELAKLPGAEQDLIETKAEGLTSNVEEKLTNLQTLVSDLQQTLRASAIPSGQPDATESPRKPSLAANVQTGTEMPVQPQPVPMGRAAGVATLSRTEPTQAVAPAGTPTAATQPESALPINTAKPVTPLERGGETKPVGETSKPLRREFKASPEGSTLLLTRSSKPEHAGKVKVTEIAADGTPGGDRIFNTEEDAVRSIQGERVPDGHKYPESWPVGGKAWKEVTKSSAPQGTGAAAGQAMSPTTTSPVVGKTAPPSPVKPDIFDEVQAEPSSRDMDYGTGGAMPRNTKAIEGSAGQDVAQRARALMHERFKGVTRRGGDLASEHLERVANMVHDPVLKAIAYLHDIIEDTDTTIAEIRARFGDRIADAIHAETWNKETETYDTYIERLSRNRDAVRSKLADIADNMASAKGWGDTPFVRAKVAQWEKSRARLLESFNTDLTPTIERKTTPNGRNRHEWQMEQIHKVVDAVPANPQNKRSTITFMGGGPAAGKTTVKKMAIKSGRISDETTVNISADDFKMGEEDVAHAGAEGIPEYKTISATGDPRAAVVVHKESTFMAKSALARAVMTNRNTVYDATMSDHGSDATLIEQAHKEGHEVVMIGVAIELDEAVRRAQKRFEETGRYLPEDVNRAGHIGFARSFPKYLDMVDMGIISKILLYDNNSRPTRLIAEKDANGLVIHDEEAYLRFVRKGQDDSKKSNKNPNETAENGVAEGVQRGGNGQGVSGGKSSESQTPEWETAGGDGLAGGLTNDTSTTTRKDGDGRDGGELSDAADSTGGEQSTDSISDAEDSGVQTAIRPGDGRKAKGSRSAGDGKPVADVNGTPDTDAAATTDAGSTPVGGTSTGSIRGAESFEQLPGGVQRSNLRLTENPAPTGAVSRIKANIAALKTLRSLEKENRAPTTEETAIMAQWSGWGSFKELFNSGKAERREWDGSWQKKYGKFYDQLRELMTEAEFNAAAESSVNAHYTSKQVVDFAWKVAARLGFKGGKAIEPSAGSGVFLGYAPENIAKGTQWTTVELDNITGKLLAQLYPQADTRIQGFEETKLPNGYFDLAISNVPFHEVGPGKEYPDLNLHNYFLARMLDKVRPGGLVIAITTKNTMEARPRQRELLASKGQLVAAIRLPNDAFKESAATEVVTDLLILRRPDGKPFEGQRWANQVNVAAEGDEPMLVNEYFAANPDMVLGKHAHEGSMYRKNEYTVLGTGNLQAKLDKALEAMPSDIMATDDTAPEVTTTQRDDYSLYLNPAGQVVESRNFTEHLPSWDSSKPALVATAKAYIATRDVLKNQYRLERMEGSTDAEIEASRKQLAKSYKAMVKQLGGTITDSTRKLKHLETDPDYYTVLGLEYTTVEKHPTDPTKTVDVVHPADVLSKRVGKPDAPPETAENAQAALAISQAYRGGMDLGFMRQLTGMDDGAIAKELVDADLAYLDVDTGKLVTRNEYLSGDIRDKYAKAIFAAKEDPQYLRNVEALKKVIPPTDPFGKLKFGIEGRWIPTTIHNQFARDEMGLNGDEVRFVATTEEFAVAGTGRGGRYGLSERARVEYSTPDRSAMELLDAALNMKRVRVMRTDRDGKSHEDVAASTNANQIVDKIKAEFDKWTHTTEARVTYRSFDSERGEYREQSLPVWDVMEREWNRKKNSFVAPTHDGSKLKLPGVTDWFWRKQHILDGVQWAIQQGSAVFAYGVGSGKTALQVIIAKEIKRLKLANKPLIVAKKPTIGQFRTTIEQLYPGSKVLIPTENDFKRENRKKLISRIASGNFDFIVVTHEQFRAIRPSDVGLKAFFDEQIDSLRQVLVEMGAAKAEFEKSTRGMAREVANIVKKIKTLKKQLDKNLTQLAKHHDAGLAFEDTGIDAILIDESHNFKNIPITTQLDNVKGVPSSFSQRAVDLMVKARNIQQRTNGRNVFFFTGTPVSNTLAELWGQIHVTNPKILDEMGVKTFDSFVTAFAEVTSNFEFGWDNKFKEVTRMAKFKNGSALTTLTRMGMSVKIGNEELGLDVPKMRGGTPQIKVTPVNPEFQRWLDLVSDISSKWDGLDKKARFESSWVPIATMRAGAAAALDPRCIFPDAADHPDSKVNTAVRDIFAEWKKGQAKRTTMMVFADMYRTLNTDKLMGFVGGKSSPVSDNAVVVDLEADPTEDEESTDTGAKDEAAMEANAVGGFNIYNDIREKLIKMGVPAHEIGVITEHNSDAKRDALFDKVRAGAVRILFGSTEKIGEGVDVPQRMSAEFHLDPPMQMTAAKMDQRIGRIIRQGNLHSPKNWNAEVDVTLYAQERSMDAPIYNMLATKGKMTLQALKGQFLGDEFDDPASELTVAMASLVAQATGDTRALEVAKLTEDVRKLTMEENAYYRQVSDVKRERDTAESNKASAETLATDMTELSKAAAEATKDKDSLVMAGKKNTYTGSEDIQAALDKIAVNMESALEKKDDRINLVLRFGDNLYAGISGRATVNWTSSALERGYSVEFTVSDTAPSMGNFGLETKKRVIVSELSSPKNLLRAVNAVAGRAETRAKEATTTAEKATKDQAAWQNKLDATTFSKADELKSKRAALADLQADLMGKKRPVPELDYGTGGEMPGQSSFMDWLDQMIASTDFDQTKTLEGVLGAPVWMTKGAANVALRAVRAAIKAGKSLSEAIRAGVAALRAKNIKGYDEAEATAFIETEARKAAGGETTTGTPIEQFRSLNDRIAEAQAELMEAIRAHIKPPEGTRKAAAKRAKDKAAAKLNRLLAEQLKAMTSLNNLDGARSKEETATLIGQTVDMLNAAQDEITERKSRGEEIGEDMLNLRRDLQARLMMLKGWTDDAAELEARGARPPARGGSTTRDLRLSELESATDPDKKTWGEWWQSLKNGLRYLTSPIPELPLTGERAEKSAPFRRGYRLFAVENNRVRLEAAEKVNQVLEPLTKLGRQPADNAALKQYYRLGTALQRAAMDAPKKKLIQARMAELEAKHLNKDPFNLFRRLVLYRDMWWRATYLKNDKGNPITLPLGLTIDDVAAELRNLTGLIETHPDGLAIAEALKRHYALTEELQKSILEHGEIIPESLRNPLYFPHHVIDSWTGRLDRVRPTTEEDFRRYLIAPQGSAKLIQTDYLKAMYLHTADVLAHNARVDLVEKYWQPYDISASLRKQHGDKWNMPWNIPAGYKLFTPFKKLPLRMDYILTREVLAEKLGVAFNDGDLKARMGESGKVLNVKPEDLHAALVAGEKIQWVLPIEIADGLAGIARRESAASNPGLGHALGLPFRAANNFWKKTKLFAPWNWIRYEYGNLSTDAIDKVLAADPGAAKYLSRAARELWTSDTGDQSPEFKAAQREGVFDTITAGEAGELTKLPTFKPFLTAGEARWENVRSLLERPMRGSKFREGVFRYAKFLADVERLRAGKDAVFAGAFHGDIEALGQNVEDAKPVLTGDDLIYATAAEISLKTYGDYNSLGVVGQWLRQYAVPFWSWQDVNFRYHANQLRNLADGLISRDKQHVSTARKAALRYAGVRVVTTLIAVGLAKEIWNQFGGVMAGLWDDDDDLEQHLSEADRRRGHIIVGKDKNGQAMVVYTPSSWSDVAEWVGGTNMKRLFMEWTRGQITLEQFISDYAKQLPADFINKVAQSAGPLLKAPYELASNKSTFPDVLDQRSIPEADRWWRLVGTMTDDRAVNTLRAAFDDDYYSQPAAEQLQQIILQIRRRDPEQWAYYDSREHAADWKEAKTGKRFEAGSYNAPDALAVRNFRKAIYRGDVATAERFYSKLLEYGYTAERLDASIRSQHPLSDLNTTERAEYLRTLTEREKQQLELATKYYSRIKALDGREKQLFPKKGQQPNPKPALLRQVVEQQGR